MALRPSRGPLARPSPRVAVKRWQLGVRSHAAERLFTRLRSRSAAAGSAQADTAPQPRRAVVLRSLLPLLLLGDGEVSRALQGELSLWQQELALYQRRLGEAVEQALPATQSKPAPAAPKPPVDPAFAALLLAAPLAAVEQPGVLPGWSRQRYESERQQLLQRELPYFQRAGTCGACSTSASPEALSDQNNLDLLSYIQYKALARQVPQGSRGRAEVMDALEAMHGGMPAERAGQSGSQAGAPAPAPAAPPPFPQLLRQQLGAQLLAAMVADDALPAADRLALTSASASLDSIRAGVRAILSYFQRQGFAAYSGIAFFGNSKYEPRNHEVWAAGEPAFLKYWMQDPATARSEAALEAEEGFGQDFVAATIQAYLAGCGVSAGSFRKYPAATFPSAAGGDKGRQTVLVAEQWTLRRGRPLTAAELQEQQEAQERGEFLLDLCPAGGSLLGCY